MADENQDFRSEAPDSADSEASSSPQVRRVGRRDRKSRLVVTRDLFPPEQETAPADRPVAEVSAVQAPPVVEDTHAPFRRPVAAPPEERFPPVAVPLPEEDVAPVSAIPLRPERAPSSLRRHLPRGDWRHNLISGVFLAGSLLMCAYYTLLWQFPYSRLNLLPPPTPFVVITATPDPFSAAPVGGQTLTDEAPIGFAFMLSPQGVIYEANANDRGCDWLSIAGTVTDLAGQPLDGYGVQVIDLQAGTPIGRVFSGASQTFGAGGYEMPLGGAPVIGQYSVQLFSAAGAPVSEVIPVVTSDRCDQNVARVNFVQARAM
jgi:hypothetical protein